MGEILEKRFALGTTGARMNHGIWRVSGPEPGHEVTLSGRCHGETWDQRVGSDLLKVT